MRVVRHLIVNADDFGQSPGVNRGIVEAHERGIVTAASLMVRFPAAAEAAAYARAHPRLDVGLHLDLGEWRLANGDWAAIYQRVELGDAAAVATEIAAQLDLFRRLLDRTPTHLDSHQHVHRNEVVLSVLSAAADRLGVPLRHHHSVIRYCGEFYGQDEGGAPRPGAIAPDALNHILENLAPGITELACHPARDAGLDTMYSLERDREVETLCAPVVRAALERLGIELTTFTAATAAAVGHDA